MSDLQDFEKLVEAAKADIVERHPEMLERGIDPNIIINAQAKQLLKANKNAEGWIASHRRDQSKIVELKAELKEKDKRIAKLKDKAAALEIEAKRLSRVSELKDERIAELEARVVNLLAWVEHLESDNQLDAAAAQLYAIDKEKAMQALESEVK